MQKFKVGDKVKVVKNSYQGHWSPEGDATLMVLDTDAEGDILVKGPFTTRRDLIQTYKESDLELIQAVKE